MIQENFIKIYENSFKEKLVVTRTDRLQQERHFLHSRM